MPATRRRSRRSPSSGATSRSRPTGGSCSSGRTSTPSTSARRTTCTRRSPSPRPQAGKMILCEKPLAMNAAEGRGDGARPSRRPSVPNMVWYNYRRIPAVTLAKQLIDEGKLGKIFHYRAKFLQDWTINADLPQGGAGPVAARRGRGRQRRDRRPARPLHRHRHLAQRRRSTTSRAMTETFIKERKHNLTGKVEKVGIDDACAFLGRFENGSLGHLRDRPATPAATRRSTRSRSTARRRRIKWDLHDLHRLQVLRPPRRRPAPRLAQHPRHRRRPSLHGQVVGARPADRLRTQLRPPGRRLPRQAWPTANPPARPSATPWKRRRSATRCWRVRRAGAGRTWGRREAF